MKEFSVANVPLEIQKEIGSEGVLFSFREKHLIPKYIPISMFVIAVGFILGFVFLWSSDIYSAFFEGTKLRVPGHRHSSRLYYIDEPQAIFHVLVQALALIGCLFGIFYSYRFFKAPGNIFIATKTKLLQFDGKKIMRWYWQDFVGTMFLNTPHKKDLTIQLKSGGTDHYGNFIHNEVSILGIENYEQIISIIEKRFLEYGIMIKKLDMQTLKFDEWLEFRASNGFQDSASFSKLFNKKKTANPGNPASEQNKKK